MNIEAQIKGDPSSGDLADNNVYQANSLELPRPGVF